MAITEEEAGVAWLAKQVGGLMARLDQAAQRLDRLDASLAEMDTRLERLNEAVDLLIDAGIIVNTSGVLPQRDRMLVGDKVGRARRKLKPLRVPPIPPETLDPVSVPREDEAADDPDARPH